MKLKDGYISLQACLTNKGRFHHNSDISKFATDSALYQVINGQPRLIAYASKRMPTAAQNYSLTKL